MPTVSPPDAQSTRPGAGSSMWLAWAVFDCPTCRRHHDGPLDLSLVIQSQPYNTERWFDNYTLSTSACLCTFDLAGWDMQVLIYDRALRAGRGLRARLYRAVAGWRLHPRRPDQLVVSSRVATETGP